MAQMNSRALIKESLQLLNVVCGVTFNPYERTVLSHIKIVFTGIITVVGTTEAFLWCVWLWSGLDSIEGLTTCFAMFMISVKYHTILNQRKQINSVLDKIQTFWRIDKYGSELENKIQGIFNIMKKMMRVSISLMMLMVAAYLVQPIFGGDRKLPLHSYHPADLNQSPQYEIAFVFQICQMFVTSSIIFGFDGLFVSFIVTITCELKMIKRSFEAIQIDYKIKGDSKRTLMALYKIVDHHNLVLDCIKDVREIYSMALLHIYFFTTTCLCAALLGIISSGVPPTMEAVNKFGLFAFFFALQLLFYCAAGSNLTEESLSISNAAYSTEWFIKTQPKLRRAHTMIIQRANKLEQLNAGGMFSLNLDSYTKIIKGTLSFFTVVQAMYKDDK